MTDLFDMSSLDSLPFPAMGPIASSSSPYVNRVYDIVRVWVQKEWLTIEAIKRDAMKNGNTPEHKLAINNCRLTLDNLATRLDNISQATLLRELKRFDAPPPGEIIRATRLHFARHLLIHTRLLVRDVARRAGYSDPQHFKEMFMREFNCLPSDLRRDPTSECKHKPE